MLVSPSGPTSAERVARGVELLSGWGLSVLLGATVYGRHGYFGGTDEQRLAYAFRRCVARKPGSEETSELLAFLRKETRRFSAGELNSWDMLGANPSLVALLPKGVTAAQLAGWTAVSRVLLNLDETITKE